MLTAQGSQSAFPPITDTSVSQWPPDDLVKARDALMELGESKGWEIAREAISAQIESLRAELESRPAPREASADYEAILGQIRGLQSIEPIIDGVILLGDEADG